MVQTCLIGCMDTMLQLMLIVLFTGLVHVTGNEDFTFPRRYVLHLDHLTWKQGRTTCMEAGGNLATVYDYSTIPDLYLEEGYPFNISDVFWIGLHKPSVGSSLLWDNGDNVTWYHWDPGTDASGGSLCVAVMLHKPYSWLTMDCARKLPYLCQHAADECRFVEYPNRTIASNNYLYLYGKTAEDCENTCIVQLGARCQSFDYYPGEGLCEFNSGNMWTLDQYLNYRPGWVYFHRTCNTGCMETTNIFVTHDVLSSFIITVTHDVFVSRDLPITRDVIVTTTHVHSTTVTLLETSTHVIVVSPMIPFPPVSAVGDPIEELQEIGEVAKEKKKTLKKSSVDDKRPSAKYVGYVAVAFLSFVFGSIVLFDLLTLCRYTKCLNKRKQADSDHNPNNNKNKKSFDWTKIRHLRQDNLEKAESTASDSDPNVNRSSACIPDDKHEASYNYVIPEYKHTGDGTSTSYNYVRRTDKYQRVQMHWRPLSWGVGDSGIDGSDIASNSNECETASFMCEYHPDNDVDSTGGERRQTHDSDDMHHIYQITHF